MANLKLKRIVSDTKAKMIQSTDNSFVLQVMDPAGPTPNKFKIYDDNTDVWLGGIFPSEDWRLDSYIHNPAIDNTLTVDVGTRGPEGQFYAIAQLENFGIMVQPETLSGVRHSIDDADTAFEFEEPLIAIYSPYSTSGELDETYFASLSSPDILLGDVPFGYINEAPLDSQYYDYDVGVLYSNATGLKNMYDWNWNVSSKFETIAPDCSGFIEKVRNYVNMNVNNNDIWLSYHVRDSLSGSILGCYGTENIVPVKKYFTLSGGIYEYQQVERILGFNRANRAQLHKSNIFSVRISNSGLNNNITDDTVRNIVQNSINNVIRNLMEKIAPAHTQLWKVEFKGD